VFEERRKKEREREKNERGAMTGRTENEYSGVEGDYVSYDADVCTFINFLDCFRVCFC
jgi:hypothetical protein